MAASLMKAKLSLKAHKKKLELYATVSSTLLSLR